MRLGRVIGSVVATRKDESLEGTKLLVVENDQPVLYRAESVAEVVTIRTRRPRRTWA